MTRPVAYKNLHSSYRRLTGTSQYLRYASYEWASVQHNQPIREWL